MTRRTVARGSLKMEQDITKSVAAIGYTWTPPAGAVDDEDVATDGSEFWHAGSSFDPFSIKYQTTDSVKVMRVLNTPFFGKGSVNLHPIGDDTTLRGIGPNGVYEFTALLYLNGVGTPNVKWKSGDDIGFNQTVHFETSTQTLTLIMDMPFWGPDPRQSLNNQPTTSPATGWVYLKAQIDYDNLTLSAKAWDAAGSEPTWDAVLVASTVTRFGCSVPIFLCSNDTGEYTDVASFRWEQIA